ncbi:hypothetical protein LWI29_023844 [Acer saccharum]|uniref:Uncharacterized protein n=1 Tax=Acer saccharum TaxID=4024 RepID=A0AA39VE59_ACESA|nr:hypothetical protein LWI29_023844 [Acer saccharum]
MSLRTVECQQKEPFPVVNGVVEPPFGIWLRASGPFRKPFFQDQKSLPPRSATVGFRSSGEVGKSDIIGSHHSMDDDERMVTDGGGEGCSLKCDDQHAEGQVSDSINGEVQSTGCIESLHTDICVGPDPVHHSSPVASKEFEDGLVDSSPIITDQVITQPKVIDPVERPSGSTRVTGFVKTGVGGKSWVRIPKPD